MLMGRCRYFSLMVMVAGLVCNPDVVMAAADCPSEDREGTASIERLEFPRGQGEGYRMTYCVSLPIEIYWQFKTDFHNDFLTGNPHIKTHRYVGREGNTVLTENRYTHNAKRLFRWQTTVHASQFRMDFKLLNPDEAGQAFHYGTIRLNSRGAHTMIYQEAHFKFSGAAFWAFYPWRGGMRSFLQSFVDWEREAALTWQAEYDARRRQEALAQERLRQVYSGSTRYPDR